MLFRANPFFFLRKYHKHTISSESPDKYANGSVKSQPIY